MGKVGAGLGKVGGFAKTGVVGVAGGVGNVVGKVGDGAKGVGRFAVKGAQGVGNVSGFRQTKE